MTGKTHKLIGGSSAFVVSASVGLPISLVAGVTAVAAAASSLPDDAEKWIRSPHRTVTHWPLLQLAVFALPVIAAAIWLAAFAVVIGWLCAAAAFACLMHSIADAMTIDPRGIQLLWPISRRGYHLVPRNIRVKVGRDSLSEKAFCVALVAIVLCFTYVRYRHQIIT